jgi:CRP-like cAMP-binding protein
MVLRSEKVETVVFGLSGAFQPLRDSEIAVKFTDDEQRLYELTFATFQPREFLKLLKLGEWKSAGKGDRLLAQSDPVTHIAVPVAGTGTAHQKQGKVAQLGPGEVIGAGMALTGQPAFIDAEFAEHARYMSWRVADVNRFMAKNPDLAIKFNDIVSRFLVGQIDKMALYVESK